MLLIGGLWIVHSVIEEQRYVPLLIYFGTLSLLFATFGFLLVSICKNIITPIVIIAIYVVTEYLTNGKMMPWYHAMAFITNPFSIEDVTFKGITNILISVFFLSLGQVILSFDLYKNTHNINKTPTFFNSEVGVLSFDSSFDWRPLDRAMYKRIHLM